MSGKSSVGGDMGMGTVSVRKPGRGVDAPRVIPVEMAPGLIYTIPPEH